MSKKKKSTGGYQFARRKDKNGRTYHVQRSTNKRVSKEVYDDYFVLIKPQLQDAYKQRITRKGKFVSKKMAKAITDHYIDKVGFDDVKSIMDMLKNWKKDDEEFGTNDVEKFWKDRTEEAYGIKRVRGWEFYKANRDIADMLKHVFHNKTPLYDEDDKPIGPDQLTAKLKDIHNKEVEKYYLNSTLPEPKYYETKFKFASDPFGGLYYTGEYLIYTR